MSQALKALARVMHRRLIEIDVQSIEETDPIAFRRLRRARRQLAQMFRQLLGLEPPPGCPPPGPPAKK